jgi:hypothetical protein
MDVHPQVALAFVVAPLGISANLARVSYADMWCADLAYKFLILLCSAAILPRAV